MAHGLGAAAAAVARAPVAGGVVVQADVDETLSRVPAEALRRARSGTPTLRCGMTPWYRVSSLKASCQTLRCVPVPAPMPFRTRGMVAPHIHCVLTRCVSRVVQPIRAIVFDPTGAHLVVGTNSRTLRVCAAPVPLASRAAMTKAKLDAARPAYVGKLHTEFEWPGCVLMRRELALGDGRRVLCRCSTLFTRCMPTLGQAPPWVAVLRRMER